MKEWLKNHGSDNLQERSDKWWDIAEKKNRILRMKDLKPGKTYKIYVALDQGTVNLETLKILSNDGHNAETDGGWAFYADVNENDPWRSYAVTGSGSDRAMLKKNFRKMPKFPED
jgi:hypothetical protein